MTLQRLMTPPGFRRSRTVQPDRCPFAHFMTRSTVVLPEVLYKT